MTKDELNSAVSTAKVRYFRAFDGGVHNSYHGTHSNNPATCKACVAVMVAEITYDNETFVGVAFRNEKDQVSRKTGRSIAIGRAVVNALHCQPVNVSILDRLVDQSYKSKSVRENLKFIWSADMLHTFLTP